mmetsp:Transcript_30082/g.65629  ORF Transcript_30082/g.65629 Transcript_30082/m.65629 type:complete len:370 (-) Transcript_30082:74-1183(-)|eukprot:CAMPEP_0170609978 /NCGR_PEP_ID=MMETSP0224-20130122/22409_1 /TAXON_ID=285029 /ORGANISM="Togula jolla, Strain CCCM 725" /LENGTH=369 /DNA_ID=CAMNT_0010935313 /DNA_START=46 /DNA_END=1155 /DNA_ORIENTATION=-
MAYLYVVAVTLLFSACALKVQDQNVPRCSLSQQSRSDLALLAGRATQDSCSSSIHTSRSLGVDFFSLIQEDVLTEGESEIKKPQLAVWVSSYPRSGSSTILSMVSATIQGDENRMNTETFSMFEPCHDGDEYEQWMQQAGCGSVLWGLSRCEFAGMNQLWGWGNSHTTSHKTKFEPSRAQDICQSSDQIAFKTVDYGHHMADWTWLLDSHPRMRVLDVVRDPRDIMASWKTTEPFATLVKNGKFYTMSEICENYMSNLKLNDDRVHHVVFENLLKDPETVTRHVYHFLQKRFGETQLRWINATFFSSKCPEPEPWDVGFTDCHEYSGPEASSSEHHERWRDVLSAEEQSAFLKNPDCKAVAEAYGYPLN